MSRPAVPAMLTLPSIRFIFYYAFLKFKHSQHSSRSAFASCLTLLTVFCTEGPNPIITSNETKKTMLARTQLVEIQTFSYPCFAAQFLRALYSVTLFLKCTRNCPQEKIKIPPNFDQLQTLWLHFIFL